MPKKSQFAKWNKWLDGIHSDVQGLLIDRYIFREVQGIIRANRRIQVESSFYEWMRNVYSTAVVIGVRRQLDTDENSISFVRLFTEIINNPQVLSRERYLSLHEDNGLPSKYAHRAFDRFSGAGGACVDPAAVQADLSALKQKAERIRKFANKRIAHFDRSSLRNLPMYPELDGALDYLERLLKKYLALFRAEVHRHIVPFWQYDWKEIFRRPWI